jgi:hypothetical protein
MKLTQISYNIVEHEDGWAYQANGTFSEAFPSREAALKAAKKAAAEQRQPGESEGISFEDKKGQWHDELSSGQDRPTTKVQP